MRTPDGTQFDRQPGASCPLCKGNMFRKEPARKGRRCFFCKNCGRFQIAKDLSEFLLSSSDPDLADLALYAGCHTRQSFERDGKPVFLAKDTWEDLASHHKNSSLEEQLTLLLDLMRKLARRPGNFVEFDTGSTYGFLVDRPYADSFSELVLTAQERGYFKLDENFCFMLRSEIFFLSKESNASMSAAKDQQQDVDTGEASSQEDTAGRNGPEVAATTEMDELRQRLSNMVTRDYTQDRLAGDIGIHASTLSRMLNDRTKELTSRIRNKIIQFLRNHPQPQNSD